MGYTLAPTPGDSVLGNVFTAVVRISHNAVIQTVSFLSSGA